MEKYLKFDRTAKRSEFWGVIIIVSLLSWIIMAVGFLPLIIDNGSSFGAIFGLLVMIATSVAGIFLIVAVGVRRCRDIPINPWWTAAMIISYVGMIVMIVLGCLSSGNQEQIEESKE
jgi:uncharacterized membrane protein YhaH (DUF805 family)